MINLINWQIIFIKNLFTYSSNNGIVIGDKEGLYEGFY